MSNNVKIQLDLTQEQFSLLFDLIFSKYEEHLKEIELPLANFQAIYEQLLNY